MAGRGVPVSYLFSNDQSALPLVNWFQVLKQLEVSPEKITIDCSVAEYNAITAVWGQTTAIQYCTWYVARAWMQKMRGTVVCAPNENKQEILKALHTDTKELMWENTVEGFQKKLDEFKTKWAAQAAFLAYFMSYWIDGEKYKRWARCYQPEIYTNMETNNYVESWLNQLKTVYLDRRRNHGLDFIIHMLVEDVEVDIKHEIARLTAKVGRMNKEEREARKQELKAKAVDEKLLDTMIHQKSECEYAISSFKLDGIAYEVSSHQYLNTDMWILDYIARSRTNYMLHRLLCKVAKCLDAHALLLCITGAPTNTCFFWLGRNSSFRCAELYHRRSCRLNKCQSLAEGKND